MCQDILLGKVKEGTRDFQETNKGWMGWLLNDNPMNVVTTRAPALLRKCVFVLREGSKYIWGFGVLRSLGGRAQES